jgi:hypothetical protein
VLCKAYLRTLIYEGARRRYCRNDVTDFSDDIENPLICQGSNANILARMYNPYVAARDKTMFLKMAFPKTVPTVILPAAVTSSIPLTAR